MELMIKDGLLDYMEIIKQIHFLTVFTIVNIQNSLQNGNNIYYQLKELLIFFLKLSDNKHEYIYN